MNSNGDTPKIKINESRGGDKVKITNIDLATVLMYFGFTLLGPYKSNKKPKRGNRNLTEYHFLKEHPNHEYRFEEVLRDFNNDRLECHPRRLLAESRNLRNLAHDRNSIQPDVVSADD